MASLNKVVLIGNLTADPELKQTQSGLSVVSFTIAVNRRVAKGEEKQADFINCVAWRKTAEFVAQHFKKGKPILVCGAMQSRSYTDNQGNKRYVTEVVADEVGFVENKSDEAQSGTQYVPDAYTQPSYSNTNAAEPKLEPVTDDGAQGAPCVSRTAQNFQAAGETRRERSAFLDDLPF